MSFLWPQHPEPPARQPTPEYGARNLGVEVGTKTVLASGDGSSPRSLELTDVTDTTLDARPIACCKLTGKIYDIDISLPEVRALQRSSRGPASPPEPKAVHGLL